MKKNRDILEATGMTFWGNHGLTDDQKATGQIFNVDIVVDLDMSNQFNEDMLTAGLTYTDLFVTTQKVITSETYNTIQHVGQRIIDELISLNRPTPIHNITVTVKQPFPSIPDSTLDYIGCTISRDF
ncbi:MAG: dihydroneopterin aldolase [Eubacteriaceae bacterium]|nr:dihydroneopterin aldolase [Eubacteriaceae bacterium]